MATLFGNDLGVGSLGISEGDNFPPVVDAGPDVTVVAGPDGTAQVQLDGSATDPDGDPVLLSWIVVGVTLDDPTRADPTGSFPVGAHTVFLLGSDVPLSGGARASAPDTVIVRVTPSVGAAFTRGDVNGDSELTVVDPLLMLFGLFGSDFEITCPDAADFNDDGQLLIDDAVSALLYIFLQGDPPPAPFPGEGLDSTPDSLLCEL